jgi:hypothetical protein
MKKFDQQEIISARVSIPNNFLLIKLNKYYPKEYFNPHWDYQELLHTLLFPPAQPDTWKRSLH